MNVLQEYAQGKREDVTEESGTQTLVLGAGGERYSLFDTTVTYTYAPSSEGGQASSAQLVWAWYAAQYVRSGSPTYSHSLNAAQEMAGEGNVQVLDFLEWLALG